VSEANRCPTTGTKKAVAPLGRLLFFVTAGREPGFDLVPLDGLSGLGTLNAVSEANRCPTTGIV